MVDISGARPHVWRIAIVAVGLLTMFLFFDPIGFASSSMDSVANRGPSISTVTHLVLFQFKRNADPAAVDMACAKMMSLKEHCLAPNSNYPYIKSITGGRDNSNEKLQHGATHAFVVQFGNMDDRNYYITHDPVHQAFKKDIEPLVEKTTVLDFTNGKFQ
ncbi:stress responsive A/B barrel domain-containing protein [Parachaetomium inaequale]|uniref:Stress responsive A/B barrel domain-containing protein n=1 Tax=Parachaetomium inaequale TaxID=2588326 RepID=A0AAN6PN80_9PEZI|nr:stress responsive A/B barrel domain-containing protein [Parachaetomium inaequale]